MQAPTHLLCGILIAELIHKLFPNLLMWINIIIILVLAFMSHFLLDAFAIFTYHPPKADWKDKVWVSYHVGIYVLSLLVVIFFFTNYWWVMIAATFVDILDWIVLRAMFKKSPILHPLADKFRSLLFSKIKDFNHTKWTILFEIGLIIILILFIMILEKKKFLFC